jgi:hypothetical protein
LDWWFLHAELMLGLDNIMGDAALALVQDASSVET